MYTNPIEDSHIFFGRQTEIGWVQERLTRHQPLLVIYGSPHKGKTALLQRLVHLLPHPYLAIYLDAGKADEWASASPLLQIAGRIRRSIQRRTEIHIAAPDAAAFAADPTGAWRAYINTLTPQLGDWKMVLLVDDADVASPEWLRPILASHVTVILAMEHQDLLSQFLPEAVPAPPSITLGPLDTEAGEALVKAMTPDKQIDPWAVRRILEVSSNHPYYIRLTCEAVLKYCTRTPTTPSEVEDVLKLVLDAPPAEFDATWQILSPREQEILSVFAALTGHGGIATQYDIQKSYNRHGRHITLQEVVTMLSQLVQRKVLEKLGANNYRCAVELFRLWVRHCHPPDQLLRPLPWQFDWSGARQRCARLGRALARRPLIPATLGLIALFALAVVLQPALLSGESSADARTLPARTVTPTLPPVQTRIITAVPSPAPEMPLSGYDLTFMSRTNSDSLWQIAVLNSHTGERLYLTETDSNERTPKWSPDGKRLIFVSERDGNRELYLLDLSNASAASREMLPINLTDNVASDWQPNWSPDGEQVVFSSYRDENWEIYTIRVDGTDVTRLTDHPENDFSPCWSPDGRQVLFGSRRGGDADLFALTVETGRLIQLTSSELDEYDPSWSPDGEWIAFATRIDDQSDIWVMRADGSLPVNITNSPYANDFQPTWSPDSQWLAFVSYTAVEGNHDIYRMRRDGSEVSKLVGSKNDDLAPHWRPPGG